MSKTKTWVWVIIILLVIVSVWWYMQSSNASVNNTANQSAAAINALTVTATADSSDAGIARSLATLNTDLATVNPNGGAAIAGPAMNKVVTDMRITITLFNSRVSNLSANANIAPIRTSLTSLSTQIANATSQIGAAMQVNVSGTQASAYIKTAYVDLQNAHSIMATIAGQLAATH